MITSVLNIKFKQLPKGRFYMTCTGIEIFAPDAVVSYIYCSMCGQMCLIQIDWIYTVPNK